MVKPNKKDYIMDKDYLPKKMDFFPTFPKKTVKTYTNKNYNISPFKKFGLQLIKKIKNLIGKTEKQGKY